MLRPRREERAEAAILFNRLGSRSVAEDMEKIIRDLRATARFSGMGSCR
jgi:hypothetical protein